jgi:hypothetical protein
MKKTDAKISRATNVIVSLVEHYFFYNESDCYLESELENSKRCAMFSISFAFRIEGFQCWKMPQKQVSANFAWICPRIFFILLRGFSELNFPPMSYMAEF